MTVRVDRSLRRCIYRSTIFENHIATSPGSLGRAPQRCSDIKSPKIIQSGISGTNEPGAVLPVRSGNCQSEIDSSFNIGPPNPSITGFASEGTLGVGVFSKSRSRRWLCRIDLPAGCFVVFLFFLVGAGEEASVASRGLDEEAKSRMSHIKASSSLDILGRFAGVGMLDNAPENPSWL